MPLSRNEQYLEAVVEKVDGMDAQIAEILHSMANPYDPTQTYAQNALVLYNGRLYRSLVAITTPEEWTPAHWQEVDFEDEITQLRAELAQKYSKPTDGIPATDMTAAVQESLGKADTALQEHQSLAAYRTAAAQDVIDAKMADDQSLVDNFSYEGVDLGIKFADEIAAAPYNGDPAKWIKGRIQAKNYKGLHNRDYFTITCTNGTIIKPQIMGINTYKGSAATEIGDHIDFISKDCWPGAIQYNLVNYNNGIGLDKFTGDGATTVFQLCHRSATTFPTLSKVTIGGADAATDSYTYDATTGVLTFSEAPASGAVIKAVWATPITLPFLASKVHAFLMSEKAGVPNEAAADPALIEVDYTNGGVWKNIPDNWKAVIADKWSYPGVRYTAGSLRTSENDWTSQNLGKLWLPDECEVYGCAKFSNSYAAAYGRMYPGFMDGNRKKGDGNGAGRARWWLLPATSGSSTPFCSVSFDGLAYSKTASIALIRVPVCFRITG